METNREGIDSTNVHDFKSEEYVFMVLGANTFISKPIYFAILNLIYLMVIYLVYLFLIIMSFVTFTLMRSEHAIFVQVLQNLCILVAGIVEPAIRYFTRDSLQEAYILIRRGVYRYAESELNELTEIKSKRMDQLRFLVLWLWRLLLSNAIANAFFIPLIQFILHKGDSDKQILNPYLPLPIYMPFNTRAPFGYTVAFLSNGVVFYFITVTVICLEINFLSCTLQLIAQIEILSHSLRNIEKRAGLKLCKDERGIREIRTSNLYENGEFQKCLYICLRENIRHHQSIIRYLICY